MARDPGWGKAIRRAAPVILIPFLWPLALRPRPDVEGLTGIRILYLHFAWALVMFLVVLLFIHPWAADAPPVSLVAFLLGTCGFAFIGFSWSWRKPIEGTTQDAVAGSYRTIFFLQMAFAQAAALFGFVSTFLIGAVWPYLVGLGVSAIAFWMMAPARRELDRRQQQLTLQGSGVSLIDALT